MRRSVIFLITALGVWWLSALPVTGGEIQNVCPEAGERPHLVLETQAGNITIELFEDAAPRSVGRLAEMARGPIFNPRLLAQHHDEPAVGYFDGLIFSSTKPRLEISVASRSPESLFEIPVEIDANALGLDQQLIADAGEAMDVAQMELHPQHTRLKASGGATGKLGVWLDRLTQSQDATFLVGVSRKEINETLGYQYQEGLESRPAVRGMVALRPMSKTTAGGGLTILLADYPRRTGRWMIVGRVVDGLSVAEEISLQPLSGPPGWKNSDYSPRDPVIITRSELICRPISAIFEGGN